MQGFCFCVSWWFAAMRPPQDDVRRRLQGDFILIPIGARVAYRTFRASPTTATNANSLTGSSGTGFSSGTRRTWQSPIPARRYWVYDETMLFQYGRLKIAAAEVVRLLAVPTPAGGQRIVYPSLAARSAA